jgi:murein DD-endopeptidase MepM/ murein hydrolase activator NlpD
MAGTITINGKTYKDDSVVAKNYAAKQKSPTNSQSVVIDGRSYANSSNNVLLNTAIANSKSSITVDKKTGKVSSVVAPTTSSTKTNTINNVITGDKIKNTFGTSANPTYTGSSSTQSLKDQAIKGGLSQAQAEEALNTYNKGYLNEADLNSFFNKYISKPGTTGTTKGTGMWNDAKTGNTTFTENGTASSGVDENGNPVSTTDGTGETEMSDEERAKLLLEQDNQDLKDFMTKYGLDTSNTPVSIEDMIKLHKEDQAREREQLAQQQEYERMVDQANFDQTKASGEASISSMTSSLSQNREGAMGALAPKATQEYSTQIQKNIGMAQSALDQSNRQRLNIMERLKEAQANGDQELASALSRNLAKYEEQIITNRTKLLEAQSQSSDLALKLIDQQNSSFKQFTDLVGDGGTFDTGQLMNLSSQLGIDFKTAYGYYNGMEQIRTDKTLDAEKKMIETEKLKIELDREMRGVTNAELEKVDYIQNLYSSGASQEEIIRTKRIMGIKDEDDPVYMAEVRKANATALIEEYEAKYLGKAPPEGSLERIKYDKALLEKREAELTVDEYLGNNTTTSTSDISVDGINQILGGRETQRFDTNIKYSIPGQRAGKHDGIDYVLPGGTSAKLIAPVSGTVKVVNDKYPGVKKGWGNQVIITDADGREWWYGHLSSVSVKNGQTIGAGESFGNQGTTGFSTGIHVDFRIKENGKWINPESVLSDLKTKAPTVKDGEYNDEQMAVMEFMDPGKLTAENKKTLKKYGLSEGDIAVFKKDTTTKKYTLGTDLSNHVKTITGNAGIVSGIDALSNANLPDNVKNEIAQEVSEMTELAIKDPLWVGRLQRYVDIQQSTYIKTTPTTAPTSTTGDKWGTGTGAYKPNTTSNTGYTESKVTTSDLDGLTTK